MRLGSLAASLTAHALMLGLFLLPVMAGGALPRPAPKPPSPTQVVLMEVAKLAPKPAPPKVTGTIAMPKKKPPPKAHSPKPKPKPAKLAAEAPSAKPKPKPKPTPTPDPEKALFDALRKHPYFAGKTDEEIRRTPLPPGMKSWKDVLAMTGELDKIDWTQAPPELGQKVAQASGSILPPEFLAGILGLLQQSSYGGAPRQLYGDQWVYAFRMMDLVMVARWTEGSPVAEVSYYPFGGQEDPAKRFEVPVDADDDVLAAAMQLGYHEAMAGRPPKLLPAANANSKIP